MPATGFSYNLRLPGQYYQAETGLSQNMQRDYDPQIGRYVESDPIGLKGGINTYAYVKDDPVNYADPLGLLRRGAGIADWTALQQAETDIRQELSKSCVCHMNSNGDSCIPCEKVEKLLNVLNTSWVLGSTNLGANTCGTGDTPGYIIQLAPQAFTNKACGCLAAVLYHELLHNTGIFDEDTEKGPGTYTLEKRCMGHLCKRPLQ